MAELTGPVLASVAKAVAAKAGITTATAASQSLKKRLLGDPEDRALKRSLRRAYDLTLASHGALLREFDVNPDFLQYEAASELARVLLPGQKPDATKLAELCVNSLAPDLDEEARWNYIVRLRPAFRTFLDILAKEIGGERSLDAGITRSGISLGAESSERVAEALRAKASTDTDESMYLHWMIDRLRHIRMVGITRGMSVQIPLDDVFITLAATPDSNPGDRAEDWLRHEQGRLRRLLDTGDIDHAIFEAELERLAEQVAKESDQPLEDDTRPVSVLSAVRDTRCLLVLGDPGSGKTTFLRYLALRNASSLVAGNAAPPREDYGAPRFPILLRIGDFARSARRDKGIGGFLVDYLESQECRTAGLADLLNRKLEAGECLVLFDGLDEVASADARRAVVEAITNFVTAHSRAGNKFVATSRIAGYLAAPLSQDFVGYHIREMDYLTIQRFLAAYCPAIERREAPEKSEELIHQHASEAADNLLEALKSNPGVRRLASNPLLLTTLLFVHRASGRLPQRRVDAYAQVTEVLGRTWRTVQGVPEAELPDDRLMTAWLTRLGAWLHANRPEGSASLRELLEVLGPLWSAHLGTEWQADILEQADVLNSAVGQGVRDFIDKIERHTGLIVERAPGRYGFPHLTFEEYYAGRAIAFDGRAADRPARVRDRLHNPRYDEPILLGLGLVGREQPEEVEALVAEAIYGSTLRSSSYESLLGRDFLFALRLLSDDIPLATATIDLLLVRALDEWFDPTSRCRFARYDAALTERLESLGGTKASGRLASLIDRSASSRAIESPERFCRIAMVLSSQSSLPAGVSAALVEIAKSAGESATRCLAARVLAGDPKPSHLVTAVLVALATMADDPIVRIDAAGTLVRTDTSAIADLVHVATTATDSMVRIHAADILGAFGAITDEVMGMLVNIATNTDHDLVRICAADVLRRSMPLPDAVVDSLVGLAIAAQDSISRINALGVLRHSSALTEQSGSVLASLAAESSDPEIRLRIGDSLARYGPLAEDMVADLTELAMTNGSPNIRILAADILRRNSALVWPVVSAMAELMEASRDRNLKLRAASVVAYSDIPFTSDVVVHSLVDLAMNASNGDTRQQAARVLGQSKIPLHELVSGLVRLATGSSDPQVRLQAVADLCRDGVLIDEAVSLLVQMALRNPEPDVRRRAIDAFGYQSLLTEGATRALIRLATRASDPEVQVRAGNLLGAEHLLHDGSSSPRRALPITASVPVVTDATVPEIAVLADRGVWATGLAIPRRKLHPDVTGAMVRLLRQADDPGVRVRAAMVLSQSGVIDREDLVNLPVGTSDPVVQVQACLLLSRYALLDEGAIDSLMRLASTPSLTSRLRCEALTAVGRVRVTSQLLLELATLARDDDGQVRSEAANTLAMLARREPVNAADIAEILAELCQDQTTGTESLGWEVGGASAYQALWSVAGLLRTG